jgi:hypothetical protein
MDVLKGAVEDFDTQQTALDLSLKDALSAVDTAFSRLDDAVRSYGKQQKEIERIKVLLEEVESNNMIQYEQSLEFRAKLALMKQRLERLKEAKPRTGSLLLRLTLGKVNVKVWKKSERVQMKLEYNSFKRQSTYVYLLLPIIQIFATFIGFDWRTSALIRLISVAHQVWLLYFYVSLSIRENILQVNGSNIQDWWIYHHYLSMCLTALFLLFPDGLVLRRIFYVSNWLLLWQAGTMIVQNNYQDRRHYVRTALGKATDIDPSTSETLVEKPTDLKLLLPFLFVTYFLQLAFSMWLLIYFVLLPNQTWAFRLHCLLMTSILAWLSIGNAQTTYSVIRKKQRPRLTMNLRRTS